MTSVYRSVSTSYLLGPRHTVRHCQQTGTPDSRAVVSVNKNDVKVTTDIVGRHCVTLPFSRFHHTVALRELRLRRPNGAGMAVFSILRRKPPMAK